MTASMYFAGADATITADGTAVGAVSGWSFEASWQENEKYASDSIFPRASAKYQFACEVKMKIASFNPDITGTWWVFKSLRGGGADGKDKNGATVTIGKIADTSMVTYFDVIGSADPNTTAGVNMTITAEDCYLTNFPFQVKENEWVLIDLTADAADLTYSNTA